MFLIKPAAIAIDSMNRQVFSGKEQVAPKICLGKSQGPEKREVGKGSNAGHEAVSVQLHSLRAVFALLADLRECEVRLVRI